MNPVYLPYIHHHFGNPSSSHVYGARALPTWYFLNYIYPWFRSLS